MQSLRLRALALISTACWTYQPTSSSLQSMRSCQFGMYTPRRSHRLRHLPDRTGVMRSGPPSGPSLPLLYHAGNTSIVYGICRRTNQRSCPTSCLGSLPMDVAFQYSGASAPCGVGGLRPVIAADRHKAFVGTKMPGLHFDSQKKGSACSQEDSWSPGRPGFLSIRATQGGLSPRGPGA